MHDPSLACTAKGCSGGISFATCSTDGTIRLWDISLQSDLSKYAEELNIELLGSSCLGNSRLSKSLIQFYQNI
jgi:WD40 repeat protein